MDGLVSIRRLDPGAIAKVAVCRGPDQVAITLTELPEGRQSLGA